MSRPRPAVEPRWAVVTAPAIAPLTGAKVKELAATFDQREVWTRVEWSDGRVTFR